MNFARALLLAFIAALLLAPPALAAKGFEFGVTPGEVTSSSALLWGKATKSGKYSLEVARNGKFKKKTTQSVAAKKGHDNTLQKRVKRLKPNTKYWFRFVGKRGKRSDVGTFRTAPKPKQNATIRFAWSGDQDFNSEPGKTTPYWNNGEVLSRMKAERNNFNVMLGDTIYSDSEVPGRLQPIALSVKQKWEKYKINLANKNLQALRRSAGFYSHWDDHEFVNDFSPAENSFDNDVNVNGHTLYNRGEQAFRDYAPVSWSKQNGIYRTVRWGRNLEVFFLDQRSFRSANADANHVCDNPDDRQPGPGADRAADHAQPVRARDPVAGAACVPGLPRHDSQPEPHLPGPAAAAALPQGREGVEGPLQGDHERAADPAVLRAPVRPLGGLRGRAPAGAHRAPEREERDLPDHGRARHARERRSLPDAGERRRQEQRDHGRDRRPGGHRELRARDRQERPGSAGSGALVDSAFFTPPPPGGIGMQCSVIDQFSYGEVTVTGSKLTVTPKDLNGTPQMDGANPCGPFVLNYKP